MLVLILSTCDKNTSTFYHGTVQDERQNPIENVKVYAAHHPEKSTVTNSKGYFKLNRKGNSLIKLVFAKHGYQTDTIPCVWSQHGEGVHYQFINTDTSVVTLRTIKYKQVE